MKIVADAHIPFVSDYFAQYGELMLRDGRNITAADVRDADILLVRSVTLVNANLLQDSRVKFVGSLTAGTDHLDLPWLKASNIVCKIASGFNAPPVADYVMSLFAALYGKFLGRDDKLRVAIIGVGNVGKLVADRLQKLNYDVVTCDPLRARSDSKFQHTELAAIRDCDVVSLHVPLTKTGPDATQALINKAFIQQQKKNCILINTSRGGVIAYDDLLRYGTHLHWCFDVWPDEPIIDINLLTKAFIATPHIAGYSLQAKRRGIEMLYRAACESGLITPKTIQLPIMLKQELQFAGAMHDWPDIVLGVFNPLITTSLMRSKLVLRDESGAAFDDLRATFNSRYEFGATKVRHEAVKPGDQHLLKAFGFEII